MQPKLNIIQTPFKNQNQHFVPQYYFKLFVGESKSICMLNKKNGNIIENVQIKKQSSQNLFYGDHNDEKEITKYDMKYSSNVKSILNLKDLNKITDEQLNILLENIAFQNKRTLAERILDEPKMDYYKEFNEMQKKHIINQSDDNIPKEINDVINDIILKALDDYSNPQKWQLYNLLNIDKEKEIISDLKIKFIINKTNLSFVFSDNPVNYTNIAFKDYKCSKINDNSAGLIILYPLSNKLMCLLYDSEVYEIENISSYIIEVEDEKEICSINKLQLHNATNSLYFSNIDEKDVIKKMWDEEMMNFSIEKSEIIEAQEITLDGVLTGKINSILSIPEPKYFPELSFLKIIERIDGYNCIYRSKFITIGSYLYDVSKRIEIKIDKKLV